MEHRSGTRLFRPAYVAALLGAAAVVGFAWTNQDKYTHVGPGATAPHFTAQTLDGRESSLEAFRGKVVLLNIWATWCAPCREEMPSMQRLQDSFSDTDFEVVAVSIDVAAGERDASGNVGGDLQAFVEEFGLSFTVLHDPSGVIQRIYQTTGVPESFLIDRDGVIRLRVAGATEWDAPGRRELVQRLVAVPEPR